MTRKCKMCGGIHTSLNGLSLEDFSILFVYFTPDIDNESVFCYLLIERMIIPKKLLRHIKCLSPTEWLLQGVGSFDKKFHNKQYNFAGEGQHITKCEGLKMETKEKPLTATLVY